MSPLYDPLGHLAITTSTQRKRSWTFGGASSGTGSTPHRCGRAHTASKVRLHEGARGDDSGASMHQGMTRQVLEDRAKLLCIAPRLLHDLRRDATSRSTHRETPRSSCRPLRSETGRIRSRTAAASSGKARLEPPPFARPQRRPGRPRLEPAQPGGASDTSPPAPPRCARLGPSSRHAGS